MVQSTIHPGQDTAFDAYANRMWQLFETYRDRYSSTCFRTPVEDRPLIIHHEETSQAVDYLSSLMHLRSEVCPTSGIGTIVWVDRSRVNEQIPYPPFTESQYNGYGQRGFIRSNDWKFLHAPTIGLEIGYHLSTKSGIVVTNGVRHLSIYDRATPFQSIIHWMLEEAHWHMGHAAVIGFQGKGALLVGNSGSGKSTTALSCLVNVDMQYLCDDKCMLSLDPVPRAFAIYNAVKLNHDVKDRFPFFNDMVVGTDEFAKKGKNLAFLYPDLKDKMVTTLPISTILIPRIKPGIEYGISPASPADAFRVFGPSTSIWVPLSGPANYRFLRTFTERVPCYFLDLHPDLEKNASIIMRHLTSKA
jgi:hypothetical protein